MSTTQNIMELLGQGLLLTVVGMGLVFGALALLWAVIELLGHVFKPAAGEDHRQVSVSVTAAAPSAETTPERAALTEERARVAAIAAAALLANAMPLYLEPPAGPTFEHGRSAPAWVTTNRARAMQTWQPPRVAEFRSNF
ncbi:MAG: OadG family protein [Anaerolineae bacterium]|nr:OadG family protein [Anaerolineae bacterium]